MPVPARGVVGGPPYSAVVRLCLAAATGWTAIDARFLRAAAGSSPFDVKFSRFLNLVYWQVVESLQYDEEGLQGFLTELDAPLPGQMLTRSAEQRLIESEMELFNKAAGAKG